MIVGRHHVRVADVRASFCATIVEPACLSLYARPLANLITPVFYNAGWSADRIIFLRVLLSVLALGLFMVGDYATAIVGVVAFSFAFVLDCVDGAISRLDNAGNYWGKYIDGLADDISLFPVPAAVGIGLWVSQGDGTAAAVGSGITIVSFLTGIARHRMGFAREWMVATSGPLTEAEIARLDRWKSGMRNAIRVVANTQCFAVWLIILPGGAWYYLLVMAILTVPGNLFWLYGTTGQASAVLRRYRVGGHDATTRPLRETATQDDQQS